MIKKNTKHSLKYHSLIIIKVARRAWTGNQNAIDTIKKAMDQEDKLVVTMPQQVKDDSLIERSLKSAQLI